MSSKNMVKKIKLSAAAVLACSSMVASPTFAAEQYNGYPEKESGTPRFYISRIDLTNNQLEFSYNAADGKVLTNFGAGWVTDNSLVIQRKDIFSYNSVDNYWSQRAFWNDTDAPASYVAETSGFWTKYIVDASVDLKTNNTGKMFYIAKFEDGDKWVSRIDYSRCVEDWTEGMSCDSQSFIESLDENHVVYSLAPAPEKFVKSNMTTPSEPVAELTDPTNKPTNEPTDPTTDPTDSTTEPTTEPRNNTSNNETDSNKTNDSSSTTGNKSTVELATATTSNNNQADGANATTATVKTIKSIAVLDSDTEDDEDSDEDGEEVDVSPEGPGDTTLNVPNLGKSEETNFNWIPYFIGGAALGGISTWFLISLIDKRKLPFLR